MKKQTQLLLMTLLSVSIFFGGFVNTRATSSTAVVSASNMNKFLGCLATNKSQNGYLSSASEYTCYVKLTSNVNGYQLPIDMPIMRFTDSNSGQLRSKSCSVVKESTTYEGSGTGDFMKCLVDSTGIEGDNFSKLNGLYIPDVSFDGGETYSGLTKPQYSNSFPIFANLNGWMPSSATVTNPIEQLSDSRFNGNGPQENRLSKLYQSIKGTDNKLYTRSTSDLANWTAWNDGLSQATIKSEPTMIQYKDKVIQAIWGTDNGLYLRTYDESENVWSNWVKFGNITISEKPELYYYPETDTVYVFAKGTDNKLYEAKSVGGINDFSSWTNPGGIVVLTNSTTCSFTSFKEGNNYRKYVVQYAVGNDTRLYRRLVANNDNQPNTGWKYAGTINLRDRVSCSDHDNGPYNDLVETKLFAKGIDNKLYVTYNTGFLGLVDSNENKSNWTRVGDADVTSSPTMLTYQIRDIRSYISETSDSFTEIFIRGTDNRCYSKVHNPNFSNRSLTQNQPEELGYPAYNSYSYALCGNITQTTKPSVSRFKGVTVITTRGTDNRVWVNTRGSI